MTYQVWRVHEAPAMLSANHASIISAQRTVRSDAFNEVARGVKLFPAYEVRDDSSRCVCVGVYQPFKNGYRVRWKHFGGAQ